MKQDISRFFLVVPPGFEDLAQAELRDKYDLPGEKVVGGLEVTCPLDTGFEFNHMLKIPARVLFRIADFKSKDFPKLFNRFEKVKFTPFLPNRNFRIHVSSSKSKLLNEKKILKAAVDAWKPELNEKNFVHNIYVRMHDDRCTVSLDTTGDLLHKRGVKTLVNQAPLRENIAAALVYFLNREIHADTIVDPMCGSGSFLIEALEFNKPVQSRLFAYQKFKNIRTAEISKQQNPIAKAIGFDIDKKTIEIAQFNVKSATISQRDIFSDDGLRFSDAIVVTNPPYGKKIKLPEAPLKYYSKLVLALSQLNPKSFGCIIPRRYANGEFKVNAYVRGLSLEFENGGFPVTFLTFNRL